MAYQRPEAPPPPERPPPPENPPPLRPPNPPPPKPPLRPPKGPGPPIHPPEPTFLSEKVLLCSRIMTGRGDYEISVVFRGELERLALLLNVIWRQRFYAIPAEHLWFMEGRDEGGKLELDSRVAQRGYADRSGTNEMPQPGTVGATGETENVDRLDPDGFALSAFVGGIASAVAYRRGLV